MTITKEFCLAVIEGISALRDRANDLEKEPLYKSDEAVGRILRHRNEHSRQAADLLAGWIRRNGPEGGIDPDQHEL